MLTFLLWLNLFNQLQSEKLMMWNHQLPIGMNSFCLAQYNDASFLLNGWSDCCGNGEDGFYSSSNMNIPWEKATKINTPFNVTSITYINGCFQKHNDKRFVYGIPSRMVNKNNNNKIDGEYLLIFDLQQQSYIDHATYQSVLPQNAYLACNLLIYNNYIYVIGGYLSYNMTYTDTLQVYDITNDSWSVKASLHQNRVQFGCATVPDSNYIYVFGGKSWNGTAETEHYIRNIERYNISKDTWNQLSATIKTPRFNHLCQYFNRHIFCFGGLTTDWIAVKQIEVFNPYNERTLNWNLSLNFGRYFHSHIIYNNTLLIAGGRPKNNIEILTIEQEIALSVTNDPTNVPSIDPTKDPTKHPSTDSTTQRIQSTHSVYLPSYNPSKNTTDESESEINEMTSTFYNQSKDRFIDSPNKNYIVIAVLSALCLTLCIFIFCCIVLKVHNATTKGTKMIYPDMSNVSQLSPTVNTINSNVTNVSSENTKAYDMNNINIEGCHETNHHDHILREENEMASHPVTVTPHAPITPMDNTQNGETYHENIIDANDNQKMKETLGNDNEIFNLEIDEFIIE